MGVFDVAGNLAGTAVDAYRDRLKSQLERRQSEALQLSLMVSASLAALGMVVDVVALQLRLVALQDALDEAIRADDLEAAEQLRGQIVTLLKEPPASTRLLSTLADYIPVLVMGKGKATGVIEGEVEPGPTQP